MKVVIGKREFKTKAKAYEYTRDLIKAKGPCTIDQKDQDYEFFTALVELKGRVYNKFELFTTQQTGDSLHLRGIRTDGTSKTISWVDCARRRNTKHTPACMLTKAMRYAVDQQVLAYRYSDTRNARVCVECKSDGELQVDHVVQFAVIKAKFLELQLQKGNTPPTEFNKTDLGQHVFRPQDMEFMREWQAYHAKHAVYQFLCLPCHKAKTKADAHRASARDYAKREKVKAKRKAKALQKQIAKYSAKLADLQQQLAELNV